MNFLLFIFALVLIIIGAPIIFIVQIFRKLYRKESVNKYIHLLAVALDQLGGSLIYGEEDWCISSIAYYHAEIENKNKWFMHLINFLFNDKNHCRISFETEYKELGKTPS